MNDQTPLSIAKKHLHDNWEDGTTCPCCGQFVKLYKRTIYAAVARELINLTRLCEGTTNFYHITDFQVKRAGGGDLAKMEAWGLVEQQTNHETKKRTSGMWRITPYGRNFVFGLVSVPKYKHFYDGDVYKTSAEHITIRDALGKKFNYSELMGWAV